MTDNDGADRLLELLIGELRSAHRERADAGTISPEEGSADLRRRLGDVRAMAAGGERRGA